MGMDAPNTAKLTVGILCLENEGANKSWRGKKTLAASGGYEGLPAIDSPTWPCQG